ncbi:MAG: UvrB/UvrC motif-containing protein [Planctomycetaceae bacterium]
MKKCRSCSKPATLHITEIQNGKAVAVHLCESCARDYLDDDNNAGTGDPGADLAAKLESLMAGTDEESQAACESCGITFAEFREQGRLGCPDCYQEFRTELTSLLENIHEDALHIGKRPARSAKVSDGQSRLMHLRHQQRVAIEQEDYEAAAKLRDEISAIENSLQNPESDADPDADDVR